MTLTEAIEAALEAQAPATAPELAARLGRHPVTVERRCRRLQGADRLRQVTGGGYALKGTHSPATDGRPRASD